MIAYTVHEPAEPSSDLYARAEQVVFVKEGFAWFALVFPILWLLYQRMWVVLGIFIGASIAVSMLMLALGASEQAAAWSSFALGALLALQANDLRRWTLESSDYLLMATVTGRNLDECEMKYFQQMVAQAPAQQLPANSDAAQPGAGQPNSPAPQAPQAQ